MITVGKIKKVKGKVYLGQIKTDEQLYPRQSVRSDNVERLVDVLKIGQEFHDPIVVEKNTGQLLDGLHRFSAYKLHYGSEWPEKEVETVIVELPQDEFPIGWLMYAAKLNNDHGLPLTQAERRRNLVRLKKEGVSEETILAYAEQVFSLSRTTTEAFLSMVDGVKESQTNGDKLAIGVAKGVQLAIRHIKSIKAQLDKGAKLKDEDRQKLEELGQVLEEIITPSKESTTATQVA